MPSAVPLPPPRRVSSKLPRPRGFGVAAVVLAVVAVGLPFGIPIYRQQVAIREIRRLGGSVRVALNGRPEWFRDRLPDGWNEVFGRVILVNLGTPTVTDADLEWLHQLPDVEMLGLDGSRVTDEGLEKLANRRTLRYVWAIDPDVTSHGIEQLRATAPQISVNTHWGRKLELELWPDNARD